MYNFSKLTKKRQISPTIKTENISDQKNVKIISLKPDPKDYNEETHGEINIDRSTLMKIKEMPGLENKEIEKTAP